jgi:hypothetical protein
MKEPQKHMKNGTEIRGHSMNRNSLKNNAHFDTKSCLKQCYKKYERKKEKRGQKKSRRLAQH